MLSDQQRMELCFTPDNPVKAREGLRGDPDDACTWERLKCDSDKNIIAVRWHSAWQHLEGVLDFKLLPAKLTVLSIYEQFIRGEVDMCALPSTMLAICVQHCRFTGTLDFSALPPDMREIYFRANKITAITDIRNIPVSLSSFVVKEPNIRETTLHIGKLSLGHWNLILHESNITGVTLEDEADRPRVSLFAGTSGQPSQLL